MVTVDIPILDSQGINLFSTTKSSCSIGTGSIDASIHGVQIRSAGSGTPSTLKGNGEGIFRIHCVPIGIGGWFTVSGEIWATQNITVGIEINDETGQILEVTSTHQNFIVQNNITNPSKLSSIYNFVDVEFKNPTNLNGFVIYIKDLKVEFGKVDHPIWTPNPNDLITSNSKVSSASSADKVNHKLKFNVYSPGGAVSPLTYDGSADTTVNINSYFAGNGISIVANIISLATTGVHYGIYGNSTAIPELTIDEYGRVTSAKNKLIDPIMPMKLLWQTQTPTANQAAQMVNITRDLIDYNFDFLCLAIQSNNVIFIPRTDANMFSVYMPVDYHISYFILTGSVSVLAHREVDVRTFTSEAISLELKDAYKTGNYSFSASVDNGSSKLYLVFGGKFTSNYMKYMTS